MAKAKAKKTRLLVTDILSRRLDSLNESVRSVINVTNNHSRLLDSLAAADSLLYSDIKKIGDMARENKEAICPRVAGRLTALEKQNALSMAREQTMAHNLAILDREHDSLALVVNANSDTSKAVADRVTALDRAAQTPAPPTEPAWPDPMTSTGLKRLAADMRADMAEARQAREQREAMQRIPDLLALLNPGPRIPIRDMDKWRIECIMIDAAKMTRMARHELITRLTDLNRGA